MGLEDNDISPLERTQQIFKGIMGGIEGFLNKQTLPCWLVANPGHQLKDG